MRLLSLVPLAAAPLAHAQSDEERLILSALVQEGQLLSEEATLLAPNAASATAEGERLDAEERALKSESAALTDAFARHRGERAALDDTVRAHNARCPLQSEDKTLVESCNAAGKELRAGMQRLDEERAHLIETQQDLNRQISQHNAARREWAQRRRDLDRKLEANKRDISDWLRHARQFFASGGFKQLVRQAGAPQACAAQRLAGIIELPPTEGLARALECLGPVLGAQR